jgi:hypothetical protein
VVASIGLEVYFARARGYLASAASMKPHTATGKGQWGVMILCVRVIGMAVLGSVRHGNGLRQRTAGSC